jgi:hypothetical protein
MSLLHAPEWAQNWAYQCGVEEEEVESGPVSRTIVPKTDLSRALGETGL